MRQQGFDRAGRNALQLFGGLIAVVICAAVVALMVPGGVQAGLHNPMSADESGDPTDTFTDTDSIWAYATSDITGGSSASWNPMRFQVAAAAAERTSTARSRSERPSCLLRTSSVQAPIA